jgi:hypothetical protein
VTHKPYAELTQDAFKSTLESLKDLLGAKDPQPTEAKDTQWQDTVPMTTDAPPFDGLNTFEDVEFNRNYRKEIP